VEYLPHRHSRRRRRHRTLLLPLLLCGCFDTDIRPPPDVVFAVFDPGGSPPVIPLPNDLTMMPARPDSPAAAQFSAPLDPATVTPRTVVVFDLTAMMPVLAAAARFDDASDRIVIAPPPTGWPVGHRIAVALVGGDGGLAGSRHQPVVASPAFFFARATRPLVVCSSATTCVSATPALSVAQASALEPLRLALAPLLDALEAQGIPRDRVVLAWTFTIAPGGPPVDGGGNPDGGA
jgi:hypothetical protein